MNRSHILLLLIPFFLSQFPILSQSPSFKNVHQSVKKVRSALHKRDPLEFYRHYQEAANQLSEKEFIHFLQERDEVGWTALMRTAAMNDVQTMEKILTIIGKKLKNNPQAIYDYLAARGQFTGKNGYNALLLASDLAAFSGIKVLIDKVAELLKDRPDLFLKFIDVADLNNEDTPLILLAFGSSHAALRYFVQKAAQVLGKDSKEFKQFLNHVDNDGSTAIEYAVDPADKEFLRTYHILETKNPSPEKLKAFEWNKKLDDALHSGSFENVLHVMDQGMKLFGNNDDLFGVFLSTRDEDGWDPLMHAAAQGNALFVKNEIFIINRIFKNPIYKYNALSSTDREGNTALHHAIERHNFQIGKHLVNALLEFVNEGFISSNYIALMYLLAREELGGQTPLIRAVYRSSDDKKFLDIIEFLLKAVVKLFGKDSREMEMFINAPDNNGYTALDYANTPKVEALLKKYGAKQGSDVPKIPSPLSMINGKLSAPPKTPQRASAAAAA